VRGMNARLRLGGRPRCTSGARLVCEAHRWLMAERGGQGKEQEDES
jgi:hypothetical protein